MITRFVKVNHNELRSVNRYIHKRHRQLLAAKVKPEKITLNSFESEKLEGLQNGIEVFNGLTMKNIALIVRYFDGIALSRGCKNLCKHCYIDAKVPIKNNDDFINTISHEDFNLFADGLKELKKRLGANLFDKGMYDVFPLFNDSDPINLKMLNKLGEKFGIKYAIERLNELNLNRRLLFDTSGWFKNDLWAEKNAKELVKFIQENNPNIVVNISVNPFHSSYAKSIEFKKAGQEIKAQKLEDYYIDRMANTLFTFLPISAQNFNILIYALPKGTGPVEFQEYGYKYLANKIFSRLKTNYYYKLPFEQRLKLRKNLKRIEEKLKYEGVDNATPTGRAQQFFDKNDELIAQVKENNTILKQKIDNGSCSLFAQNLNTAIDANGKIYLDNTLHRVSTNLSLNFTNKNKKTAPFYNTVGHMNF